MRSRSRLVCTALVSLAWLSACSTTLPVRSLRPGPIGIGPARHLIIVDGEGRRSAREVVFHEFLDQARSTGFFTAEDRSEEGAHVRLAGRRAIVQGGSGLDADEAGLRVDVLEWTVHRDLEEVEREADDGSVRMETLRVRRAEVVLAVSVFDPLGGAYLAEREYEASWESRDPGASRDELLEAAARNALGLLFHDIAPREVQTRVRLDDEDPGQEAMLATARAGNLAQAASDTTVYLGEHPLNSAAAYNLAVYLDAMGRHRAALAMYDEALALGNKGFYQKSRAGCARRLAHAAAMADESS